MGHPHWQGGAVRARLSRRQKWIKATCPISRPASIMRHVLGLNYLRLEFAERSHTLCSALRQRHDDGDEAPEGALQSDVTKAVVISAVTVK
jgi:hypothetical protein